jgi:TatD DNase family protein
MGLDYHYMNSPKEVQREVFIKQMELAREVDLPIIIHDREAHAECLELIQTHGQGLQGVFHCFSGSKEFALEVIRLGFYVSFAGPVTYKNARNLKEAAQVVPLDRILIETDCPYLAPDLYRGKRNEPLYVGEIAKEIGELRKISLEEVSEATLKNACDLFTISL